MTSIQKFLRHKKLNTTMVYARAHDQTVEADYFAAMRRIEQRLALVPEPQPVSQPVQEQERTQLLGLPEQLTLPELSFEMRLQIACRMRGLLTGDTACQAQDGVGGSRSSIICLFGW